MIIQVVLFVAFTTVLLGTLLRMYYRLRSKTIAIMYLVSLLALLAFYLLHVGSLQSFTVKGLSAEASFVHQTSQRVIRDAEEIAALHDEIKSVVASVKDTEDMLNQRVDAILRRVYDSHQQWTTNIVVPSDGIISMNRSWGMNARLELSGPATLTVDIDSWPNEGTANVSTYISTGPYTLTIATNNLRTKGSPPVEIRKPTYIWWVKPEGSDVFDGVW